MQCGTNPGLNLQPLYVLLLQLNYLKVLSQINRLWGKQSASVIFLTSYACQDEELASKILNVSEKQQFYREVASTAETGWDFSTRWMR